MGKIVNQAGVIFSSITSPTLLAFSMGGVGFMAMGIAIAVGVWMSIRIGIGQEIRKTPSFTWWVINRLAFLVGATNLASFTIYFLQARLGYLRETAAGPAALLTMFVGVFILISALPSGWLADRFGHKRLVIASGVIAASGTLIAILVPSLPVIYAGGCIIGAGIGLFYTANWALGTEIVPKNQAGRFLGLSNLAGAGAGAVGAYIGGPIADYMTRAVPDFPGLGYLTLFAIYGTLFLFSVLPMLGVKETN